MRLSVPLLMLLVVAGCHRAAGDVSSAQVLHPARTRTAGDPYVPASLIAHTGEIQIADRLRQRLGAHPHPLFRDPGMHAGRSMYSSRKRYPDKAIEQ